MKAENWMVREVHTCRPETSLNEAARQMWEHDCGVLPVVDDEGTVVGMLTDRDLCMDAYFRGRPLNELCAKEAMSRTVFSCRPTDSIEDVIRCMADHQVRRVPVVNARGAVVGILSMNDIVRRLVGLQDERQHSRLASRLVEALASISETRGAGAAPPDLIAPRPGAQPAVAMG